MARIWVAFAYGVPPAKTNQQGVTMHRPMVTIDGNEAAAHVAYRTNEVIAIYPITPSSPMGEWADQWHATDAHNIWGTVPLVQEMQSEGGAVGAVHGALQTGALTTTFTASQGLLLMIPNMYKIAGELTSTVFHIAARSLAAQGLSIFGDHSDVMAARSAGWGMLFANSVQEVHDFALLAQASTLESRLPFLHVFDGFRTSHEVMKIELLDDDDIRYMIDEELVRAHRARGLTPDRPVMRGTAQNPDTYFQSRETVNPYYQAAPGIVQAAMDRFAQRVGRQYHLFDYVGAADADRVIILMGSGAEAVEETVAHLRQTGERVGVLKVRLYRPFAVEAFIAALPATTRTIAVLDRTKEPGASGEPLYQDVLTALVEGWPGPLPKVVGGRYGLSSKEFTPAMVKGIFDELATSVPRNHFTIGIVDDVTNSHLRYDPAFSIEPPEVVRAMFWGLGADGTVGANKNSIKIIGEETEHFAQGYFVYDSKKSGARTISHLRFGPAPIRSTYLIERANFVAVHQFGFLERYDVLANAEPGATLLLNSTHGPAAVWDHLPRLVQGKILEKRLRLHVIDALDVARQTGMGGRINTIMQTCFFAISGVLPRDEAIAQIKRAIAKTYGKRGEVVVQKNYDAVDATLANLHEVEIPAGISSTLEIPLPVPADAPAFVRDVTGMMIAGRGDELPVSALPVDGTYPTGTTRWEKRNIALEVPVWDDEVCIQCGKCVLVCPHAVIRAKVYDEQLLADAPPTFRSTAARWKEHADQRYTLQVAVEDCTGCTLCVEVCPARNKSQAGRKAINMAEQLPLRDSERANWDFFLQLPDVPRHAPPTSDGTTPPPAAMRFTTVKNVQLLEPLFEFSGACAGCGETPYLKLVSQLYGDHAIIANATGCSSIYGGNLPTTPWTTNKAGRGPAWSNSLFEDNAEFGLGMRLTLDKQGAYARELVRRLTPALGEELADALLAAEQTDDGGLAAQRERVAELRRLLAGSTDPAARDLHSLADVLTRKSVWIVGGDGWAYDIGFGGLDHVMASGRNINILVLDTEVYSNTGGQASKATPLGAVAKFATGGKPLGKKDLGMMAINYGHVYVAQVAMGADDAQTLKAIREAEAYDGPSLVIAYSHCIAHGINMAKGLEQQRLAVESGHWPLYRHDPRRVAAGDNPFQLDCKAPRIPLKQYIYNETRYRMLVQSNPEAAAELLGHAQAAVNARWARYAAMAGQGA
jgi:pyruvate-ferredoxin/flavodoxin oxidoreductase